ncbi:putative glucuronosyltransferase [Lupinus albus]|uniref:Hexosyltransferase n=1 Tax=Lupinus albus TaxID=3870 RepID=A0A6A4P3X1_LUPAL|nr:putative glucuronosyltransferase [Lupinus albus]
MPMPKLENYKDLNVVVAKLPCVQEGVRDLFWLQVNLVVANLVVESGWVENIDMIHKKVYVVFVGYCEPMIEIFRCDDLLMHEGEYLVYQPDLMRLKQKTLMPLGSCEIAPISSISGKELQPMGYTPKLAYVSVLHFSESYVCGAIALAQSILQNKGNKVPTPDLVLLIDDSIGPNSIIGLKSAGWKIKHIKPISNPYSKNGSYNELNYSKLRIWQLTMYDKIIFMDSDILVHKNIDEFFSYPQLSVGNSEYFSVFNSGLMIIEPSQCMLII